MKPVRAVLLVSMWLPTACGPTSSGSDSSAPVDGAADARVFVDAQHFPDGQRCAQPPNQPGPEVVVAPQYAPYYTIYDLGEPPGVPNPLGGVTISADDENVMLIAGGSERSNGGLYAIHVERGPCGHILGFVGTATRYASTPFVDANLVYTRDNLMFYTEWPRFMLSQLLHGASSPSRSTDLRAYGMVELNDQGAGGHGLVPPGLAAAGEMRAVSWPGGRWYHIDLQPFGSLYDVTAVTEIVTLGHGPGGFAYVPAGSPGFPDQAVMVAEWLTGLNDHVAVYDVDSQGDPIVSTRREFLSKFPYPWGAYFEPLTGDYFFLSWGAQLILGPDRIYVVQGFVPPPPVE